MSVTPCQKSSDLSGPCLLLIGNLKVPFLASLCQRLPGALLPRVTGWVAAAEWLVSFTSSGGTPSSLFCQFLPEGLQNPVTYSSAPLLLQSLRPAAVAWTCTSSPPTVCLQLAKSNLCLQTECLRFCFLPPCASVIILLWILYNTVVGILYLYDPFYRLVKTWQGW